MQGKTSVYHQMIDEICQEDRVELTWLSSDWIAVMQREGKMRRALGYGRFDLNPAAASGAAADKYVTFDILRHFDIPVIEHAMLYESNNHGSYVEGRNTLEYIAEYFTKHNNHIVIKPNAGHCGLGISQITDLKQVPAVLDEVFRQSFSASMCPFYDIEHEYRAVMLDGEARLVYQKNLGDDWRFNLSQGASVSQIDDEALLESLVALAQKTTQVIGLRFCSVDIIKTTSGEMMIIEVNSGVSIVHYLEQFPEDYTKVKSIYRDAIQKMFEA